MKRPHTHFEEADMNLTPLIDVVFIVLIIFIIIAPMLELDRVELATASRSKQESTTPEPSSLSIYVKNDNTIWYGSKCVNPSELTQLLRQARASMGNRAPQLFQDKRATFGTYQAVKNAVEDAGYPQMDIILKPS
jgi:biopolymer transport protein ExbD